MPASVAELRLIAMRFEAKQFWGDAARKWEEALAIVPPVDTPVIAAIRSEIEARLIAASNRSREPFAMLCPPHVIVDKTDAKAKSHDERNPGAVDHLPAGPSTGPSGAV